MWTILKKRLLDNSTTKLHRFETMMRAYLPPSLPPSNIDICNIYLFIYLFIYSFIRSLIYLFIYCSIPSESFWLTDIVILRGDETWSLEPNSDPVRVYVHKSITAGMYNGRPHTKWQRHDSISTATIGQPKIRGYLSTAVPKWSESWIMYDAEVQWIANKG
jgi:hypothetical protein